MTFTYKHLHVSSIFTSAEALLPIRDRQVDAALGPDQAPHPKSKFLTGQTRTGERMILVISVSLSSANIFISHGKNIHRGKDLTACNSFFFS